MRDTADMRPVPGRVSVMIPAYNQVAFLEETIASVRAQAYPDLEIVVTDDGSTDATPDLIRRLAAEDERIVPAFAASNGGQSVNTNRGLDLCTGEFVALLGGDDIMLPGKIAAQVEFMRAHQDCGVCTHDMEVFDSRTGASLYRLYDRFAPKHGGVESLFTTAWMFGREVKAIPSSSMYRASCIGTHRYDLRLRIVNEWLFEIDCLAGSGLTWRTMPQLLGRYRVHDRQMSRSREAEERGYEETMLVLAIAGSRYPELARLIRNKRDYFLFRHLVFGWLPETKQAAHDAQFRIEAGIAKWAYMRAARLVAGCGWLIEATRPARRVVQRLVDHA